MKKMEMKCMVKGEDTQEASGGQKQEQGQG